jgi:hypothetical protein
MTFTSVRAVFEFEGMADVTCDLDEIKHVVVSQPGKSDHIVECGLKTGHEDGAEDVIAHLQPYVRNRGTTHFTNFAGEENHYVLPNNWYLEFQGTGSTVNQTIRWDRSNKTETYVNVGGICFGLRDGWAQEPAAIQTFDDGRVRIYMLDDTNPNYVYPLMPSTFRTPGIPESANHHTLRGGLMKMWDVYVLPTGNISRLQISNQPTLSAQQLNELWMFIGMQSSAVRSNRPARFKKLLDSMYRLGTINVNGHDQRSAVWYWIRGDDRFHYHGWDNDIFNVSNEAHNIGWKQWPDIWWADGPYNLGYDWLLTAIRLWLNTRNTMWWNIIERWARFAATTSLCWNTELPDANAGLTGFDPEGSDFVGFGKWGGRQWYEKGEVAFGNEVGAGYWPSEFKQYAWGLLAASIIYPDAWWLQEGLDFFLKRLDQDGQHNWGGTYGHRTAGWKMMNAAIAHRKTGRDEFRVNAIAEAHNFINLCKSNGARLWETSYHGTNSPWNDQVLGIPYVGQNTSANRGGFQTWMLAKVAMGLLFTAFHCNPDPDDRTLFLNKAKQIGDFLTEYAVYDTGHVVLNVGRIHPSRFQCNYLSGTEPSMIPNTLEGGLSWLQIPVGYAAIRGNQKARRLYARLIKDNCTYVDKSIESISRTLLKWDGDCGITDLGNGQFKITHMSASTAGLTVGNLGHHVMLKSPAGKLTWHRIISLSGDNEIVITDALAKVNRSHPGGGGLTVLDDMPIDSNRSIAGDDLSDTYHFVVTGPQIEDCNHERDFAIRGIVHNPVSLPNQENAEVDWASGQHFNSWWKNWGFVLYNWDTPWAINQLIEALEGNIMGGIGEA